MFITLRGVSHEVLSPDILSHGVKSSQNFSFPSLEIKLDFRIPHHRNVESQQFKSVRYGK